MRREYGIDLLKMAAMIMVVAHHVLQGGGVESALTAKHGSGLGLIFEYGFHYFCYCAVDCFVLCTGFIMWSKEFRYGRIFRLWRQIVGYSLAILIVAYCILPAGTITWREWGRTFLPVCFNAYWFFTEYFALFLLMPFLNKFLLALDQSEAKLFALTGFVLLSCASLVAGKDLFVTKWGYSLIWFMYLYLIGALISKYEVAFKISPILAGLALLVGCVVSSAGIFAGGELSAVIGGGARLADLGYSYTSPSLLLEAMALLSLFARLKIKSVRLQSWIAFAAPSTFIVYVVHSNNLFRTLTHWGAVFLPLADLGCGISVLVAIVIAVILFGSIVGIDMARRRIWKKLT